MHDTHTEDPNCELHARSHGVAVSIQSASIAFDTPSGRLEVLQGVSFDVSAGEIVSLVGPSGCGKSTLLNVLSRQIPLDSGQVVLGDSTDNSPSISCMWQEDHCIPWRTVKANVSFPLEIKRMSRSARRAVVAKWVKAIGLLGFEDSYPSHLSGGMRKRLSLATALAAEPELLLLDEPLGMLDHWSKQNLQQEILNQWKASRPTIVLVTHAAEEAVAMSDRIIVLTSRPARIFEIIENRLPRPRVLSDLYLSERFHSECRNVWKVLKEATTT